MDLQYIDSTYVHFNQDAFPHKLTQISYSSRCGQPAVRRRSGGGVRAADKKSVREAGAHQPAGQPAAWY